MNPIGAATAPEPVRQASRVPSATVDPRVTRSRNAVLRAATELLVEGGPNAVTIDAIVARSGVAKSTIYRHWESRDDVLVSVIEHVAPHLPEPDPADDVVTALRTTLHALVASFNDPNWARVVPALLMLRYHEASIAALEERLERQQDTVLTTLLRRACAEGLLRADLDIPEAIALVVGPLLFAHLTESVPLDDAFADRTLDTFLRANRPDAR
jgi:AcrR family transcriptional regulator